MEAGMLAGLAEAGQGFPPQTSAAGAARPGRGGE